MILPLLLLNKNRQNIEIVAAGKALPSIREVFCITVTFGFTVLAWVVFRAENLSHAFDYLTGIFSLSVLSVPDFTGKRRALVMSFGLVGTNVPGWPPKSAFP